MALKGGAFSQLQIGIMGRCASALCASLTAVALALLARRMGRDEGSPWAGVFAGACAGVLIVLNPLLFELAHYMKEDTFLTAGLALSFLATNIFWVRRDLASTAFAGTAIAFAVSGKYLGWLIFPFVVWIVLIGASPRYSWKVRLMVFLSTLAVVWAILNHSFFSNPAGTFNSVSHEMDLVIGGQKGMTRGVPHHFYWYLFKDSPRPLQILFGVFVVGLLARWRKTSAPERLFLGFTIGLPVLMSFVPKLNIRYYLPVEVAVCFGAGLGAVWAATLLTSRLNTARTAVHALICLVLTGTVIMTFLPELTAKYAGLQSGDTHELLKAYIREHLPPTAIIAEDNEVNLPTHDDWTSVGETFLPQRVVHDEFAADLGSIPELRRLGVTHVATATLIVTEFRKLKSQSELTAKFNQRKAFYQALGALPMYPPMPGVHLLWAAEQGPVKYVEVGLRLYDISGVPSPAATGTPP